MNSDTDDYHAAIKVGLSHVDHRNIVTFGIKPTHAETGYSYLELSKNPIDSYGASNLNNL